MTERNMQLQDWLDDLCVRFLMNGPKEDLETAERICFRVEEAQWYYEDFIRPLDPTLPSMSLKHFCEEIFAHCPLLSPFSEDHRRKAFDAFLSYKKRVPVRGAILLNREMDRVVLVKGWKKGANWSFPRGKINKDEDDLDCAIREVHEETGFDLGEAGFVPADRRVKSIDLNMHEQQIRLFVFRDIPMDTHFEPRTRKEISAIDWWRLSDLPAFRKKKTQTQQPIPKATNFYMVAPFLTHLRKWIVEQKNLDVKPSADHPYQSSHGMIQDDIFAGRDRGAELNTDQNSFGEVPATSSHFYKNSQPMLLSQDQSPQYLTGNTGPALLALLHNNAKSTSHKSTEEFPVRPLDYEAEQMCMPATSHDQSSHHSKFIPATKYPIYEPSDEESISYHPPPFEAQYSRMIEAQKHIQASQQRRDHPGPHPNQPQHLIHPQPLPPHVQRAVFAQSPIPLSPLAPKVNLNPDSTSSKPPRYGTPNASRVPEFNKQGPLKLSNHTLALLNSFKSRDARDDAEACAKFYPVQKFIQTPDPEYLFDNLPAVPTPPVRRNVVQEQVNHTKSPPTKWNSASLHLAHKDDNYAQQQELEMARRRAAREQGLLQESDNRILQDIWRQSSMNGDLNSKKIRANQASNYQIQKQSWENCKGSLSFRQSIAMNEFMSRRNQSQSSNVASSQDRHSHLINNSQNVAHYHQPEIYANNKSKYSNSSNSPQELSTSSTRSLHKVRSAGSTLNFNGKTYVSPDVFLPRQPVTEQQKTALLGLFKNSDSAKLGRVKANSSKSLSINHSPPAIELSASDSLTVGAQRTSEKSLNEKWSTDNLGHISRVNHESNLPFKPTNIFPRLSDVKNQPEVSARSAPNHILHPDDGNERSFSNMHQKSSSRNSPIYQPHILKRQTSKLQFPINSDRLPLKSGRFSESPIDYEYNYTQSADHRQNLLSLFSCKTPPPPPHDQVNYKIHPQTTHDTRPHYGANPVPSRGQATRKESQPISPADKGFLLSYLNAVVVKGVHCRA